MTTPRIPLPEPGANRLRAAGEPYRLEAADRTPRRLAMAALVLSVVGLGLAAWNLITPADGGCQSIAWSTTPATKDLPANWTVAASQYDVARKSMSLLGPVSVDETGARAVVYATITCYPDGAVDAVTRSADAATAAGQRVTSRNDLGDGGFSAADDAGATFLQFRHDRVVVYLAASGDATQTEVDQIASAFDRAMGGDGGAVAVGTQDVITSAAPTTEPETAAPSDDVLPSDGTAPELEAVLPTRVGDLVLIVDSATGSLFLGDDQVSRAIAAALRADGREPDDLAVAQAYDETAESDLSMLAVSVDGMSEDKVTAFVLQSWLSANGAGVKTDSTTLSGRELIRIDYGDGGPFDYVTTRGAIVIVITTANPDLAAQAVAALP